MKYILVMLFLFWSLPIHAACSDGKWAVTAENRYVMLFELTKKGGQFQGTGFRKSETAWSEFDISSRGTDITTNLSGFLCEDNELRFNEASDLAKVNFRWRVVFVSKDIARLFDDDMPQLAGSLGLLLRRVDRKPTLDTIESKFPRALDLYGVSPIGTNSELFDLYISKTQSGDYSCPKTTELDTALESSPDCWHSLRNLLRKAENTLGAVDRYRAAFLLHHSELPGDIILAHHHAYLSSLQGYPRSRWLFAATMDRILVTSGKQQFYGTQSNSNTKQKLDQIGDEYKPARSDEIELRLRLK